MNRSFLDSLEGDPPTVVDCGTCPVNVSCAVNDGGLGIVFRCCGTTAVQASHSDDDTIYVVDCQRHGYKPSAVSEECEACPLCTGDVIYGSLSGTFDNNIYVPTVYAKVPLRDRLRHWRNKLPEAKTKIAEEIATAKEET